MNTLIDSDKESPRHSEKKAVVGIDIGGTQIKMAAFSAAGKMVNQWVRETNDRPGTGVPEFAETVRKLVIELNEPEIAFGIAAPGLPSRNGRAIAHQPGKMHGLEGLDWTSFLGREKTVPVLNDAQAALLGEVWQGAASGSNNAILLTLGTGVGGAVLSDGRLLKGAIGRAGHLGHVSINESLETSIFGTPGSLEMAIGNATVKTQSGGRFDSTRKLVEAHAGGDAQATEVWLKSVRALARAITSYINCFDPELIILGGGIAKAGEFLFRPLNDSLNEMEWCPAGHRVRIVPAALGEWAGTFGAGWNALNSTPFTI